MTEDLTLIEAEVRTGAACTGVDPRLFTDPGRLSSVTAARYCARCPVQLSCFIFALEIGATEGIWGGTLFGAVGPITEPVMRYDA